MKDKCPTCGTTCEVNSTPEGTGCFIPADERIAVLEAENKVMREALEKVRFESLQCDGCLSNHVAEEALSKGQGGE